MPEMITRSNAEALIPDEVSREILQSLPQESMVMQLGRRLPNLSTQQRSMPVLNGLLTAGFVDGDTGLKTTSSVDWTNVRLKAEEIAVIIPIPEAVLDDADYDIWGEIRPRIGEEFARVFDGAVLFGTNKPQDWPDGVVPQAIAKGHSVDLSTEQASNFDLYDVLLGTITGDAPGVCGQVEEDGFDVNGYVAARSMKSKFRGLRDSGGQPIYMRSMQDRTRYELDGEPLYFPRNGTFNTDEALVIAGDWTNLVWALRQDITYKILDQAVIQDASGNIIYNLAQQDMVAMRAVMRVAWALPVIKNRENEGNNNRFPFSVLVP